MNLEKEKSAGGSDTRNVNQTKIPDNPGDENQNDEEMKIFPIHCVRCPGCQVFVGHKSNRQSSQDEPENYQFSLNHKSETIIK